MLVGIWRPFRCAKTISPREPKNIKRASDEENYQLGSQIRKLLYAKRADGEILETFLPVRSVSPR